MSRSSTILPAITILPDRAVFEITGDEAKAFLQGLVTSNVEMLGDGMASHAGLLTPQGKIMFDFFAIGQNNGYLIDCPTSQLDDIIKRLTFYKLRAKVDISARPDVCVAACWEAESDLTGDFISIADPRLTDMGQRFYGRQDVLNDLCNAEPEEYLLHRIINGIPDSVDIGSSQTFPHEANFDLLGGVSFTKGCYVGQEVVSRMQHRGTARSRIIPVTFTGKIEGANVEIRAGGKKIGQMLSTVTGHGLALLRLDRAKSANLAGDTIEANGTTLTLVKPVWATFEI